MNPNRLLLMALLALFAWAPACFANAPSEYRLKAAFLFNFLSFTEWPANVGNSLQLCVYGPDPFGEDLDKLQGRAVGPRTVATRRVASLEGLAGCQAIFVTRPVIGNLDRLLAGLGREPVLTIADSPDATRSGVALNLSTERNKVTFEANLVAARAQGLNLSAKLLRLATEVRQ